jgi:hypothetical protein
MAVHEKNHQTGCASGRGRSAGTSTGGHAGDKIGTRIRGAVAALILMQLGCASSTQVLTGTPRAAIPAAAVRVYTQAPQRFEEIADFTASRKSVSAAGGERAIARMIESMRTQAAQLGANGLLLEDFSDSTSLGLGTGVGSQTYTHNGAISLGVGGSLGLVTKVARARAIFIVPAEPSR